MRPAFSLILLIALTACGLPTPEAYIIGAGAAAAGYVYKDDIKAEVDKLSNTNAEDLPVSDTLDAMVPPRAKTMGNRIANHFRDNVKATTKHVKAWWNYEPVVLPPHDVPDSYCYRTQGDVLCYRSPMPGWEHRLVGYQGTYAAPPPIAMMEPMPAQSVDTTMLPENRLAAAQPVFTAIPEEVKPEEPKDKEITLDTAPENVHETITDPTLSPQL